MRFCIPQFNAQRPELTGEAHTHAAYSLRIHPGDFLTVFDGKGTEYSCAVKEIKRDKTTLRVLESAVGVGEPKLDVTLYMSVIKQDRFELTAQKVTELGVKKIVPVYSAHSQRNISLNYDRLNKIVASACEQCGRSELPIIEKAIEFDELVERAAASYMIFPWERELNGSLAKAIDKTLSQISVYVGPEGGITTEEKQRLVDSGARSVTLGKRILRAETAAISALSVIYYEMGEWDL